MSEKELAGKVAIVTGAGRNIGRAIALHLAQAGASVVINVRSNKTEADNVLREIEAAGGKATAVLGDVSDEKTAFALAEAAINRFGRIDFLVNNAALRREKPITEMSYADWREVMGVILDGTFHCVHACLPAMRKNGGTIINIGGMSAHIGSKDRAHVMTARPA
jgi:3-oxoacyl-[acyl-carrier protein] reductase